MRGRIWVFLGESYCGLLYTLFGLNKLGHPRNTRNGQFSVAPVTPGKVAADVAARTLFTYCVSPRQQQLMLIDYPARGPGSIGIARLVCLFLSLPPSSILSDDLKLAVGGFSPGFPGQQQLCSSPPPFPQPGALNFLSLGSRFSNSEFIFKWSALFPSF